MNSQIIENSIQTNGTLITDEWAEWLAFHKFKVGISIDGTSSIHNLYRVDVSGHGSWDRALRGAKRLHDHGVRTGALMVVHAGNYHLGRESIYTLYQEGFRSIGFNFYFEPSCSEQNSHCMTLIITPKQAAQFLEDVLAAWLEIDDPEFKVREIDDMVAVLLGHQAGICSFSGKCDHYISITTKGDIYPCERIPQSQEVFFGNIKDIASLSDILKNPVFQRFQARVRYRSAECERCNLKKYCNNGCTYHRVDGKYYFCHTRRQTIDVVGNLIGEQLFYLENTTLPEV